MIITYDPQNLNVLEAEARKAKALQGCHVCPICGETRELWEVITTTGMANAGITEMGYSLRVEGFFNMKTYQKDHFMCCTCTAQWESDEYRID